jgi:hypothetical protein
MLELVRATSVTLTDIALCDLVPATVAVPLREKLATPST